MPFDAAHWCAISQVDLSVLLCLRCHGHITVWILLIMSCKKEWDYCKSSLNLMQIHIWTTWFKGKFLIVAKNTCCIFVCLLMLMRIAVAKSLTWCKLRRWYVHALWCRSLMCNIPGQRLNFSVLKVSWTYHCLNIVYHVMQKIIEL